MGDQTLNLPDKSITETFTPGSTPFIITHARLYSRFFVPSSLAVVIIFIIYPLPECEYEVEVFSGSGGAEHQ